MCNQQTDSAVSFPKVETIRSVVHEYDNEQLDL